MVGAIGWVVAGFFATHDSGRVSAALSAARRSGGGGASSQPLIGGCTAGRGSGAWRIAGSGAVVWIGGTGGPPRRGRAGWAAAPAAGWPCRSP